MKSKRKRSAASARFYRVIERLFVLYCLGVVVFALWFSGLVGIVRVSGHDGLTVAEVCQLARDHGNGVPPDLVVAQVWEESGGQPAIVSSAGAVGLLQVVKRFHPDIDLTDPATNIEVGTHVLIQDTFYLSHKRAGWSSADDIDWSDSEYLRRGLAGYVMGPGNVTWYDKHSDRDWPENVVDYVDVIERVYEQEKCA